MRLVTADGAPFVAQPTPEQWAEANAASRKAAVERAAGNHASAVWWSGVSAGYQAAYAPAGLWRNDLTVARRSLVARVKDDPADIIDMLDRWQILVPERRRRILFDSGVLAGFLRATDGLDNAEVCCAPGCEQRILTSLEQWDQAYSTPHGWVCNDDCHISYDGPTCCRAERREGLVP